MISLLRLVLLRGFNEFPLDGILAFDDWADVRQILVCVVRAEITMEIMSGFWCK